MEVRTEEESGKQWRDEGKSHATQLHVVVVVVFLIFKNQLH